MENTKMIRLNQVKPSAAPENVGMDETNKAPFAVEGLSRPQAIDRIRRILNALQDEERCACAIASRYGLFCQGFVNLSDAEFRQRVSWIARKRPRATREELEKLVSQYHLARQEVTGTAVCCDAETREHCACDGWNGFDNRTLEESCLKLTGRPVKIG
jgi:hypothetical protein